MKKFICVLTAATLSAGLAVFGTGCTPNDTYTGEPPEQTYSTDTYTGELSEQTYSSQTIAASAFVENELSGAFKAEYSNYITEGQLSDEQINQMNLTDEQRSLITSAEYGQVHFSAETHEEPLQQTLYIVQLGNEYAYYCPALSDGDKLTESYYSSVTSPIGFDSFTLTIKLSTHTNKAADGPTVAFNNTSTQIMIEYDGNAMHMVEKLKLINDDSQSENYGATHEETNEYYFVSGNNCLIKYKKYTDTFYTYELIYDSNKLYEILIQAIGKQNDLITVDHSCFIKTNYGFCIDNTTIEALLDKELSAVADKEKIAYDIDGSYTVKSGLISKCTLDLCASVTMGDEIVEVSSSSYLNISKLNSTKVNLPDNLP